MNILITGSAGFIGFHLANQLCRNKKNNVYGIDNFSNYYDVRLKKKRNQILKKYKNFKFFKIDISSKKLSSIFTKNKINLVFHLAAQAGVRLSISEPKKYLNSNIVGFFNILENCKSHKIKHLIFASSSSVYGDPKKIPMDEILTNTDKPLSFYAATKKSNEAMAYSYSATYKIPITCLRFFTVYGPWGRPDMFFYKILNSAKNKKTFSVYDYGNHNRDFTYIDDVITIMIKILNYKSNTQVPYRLLNIGEGKPIKLKKIIKLIEKIYGSKIKIKFFPRQLGDVKTTFAASTRIKKLANFFNFTDLSEGIKSYITWFNKYY